METPDVEFLAWLSVWNSDEELSDEEMAVLYEVYRNKIAA